jgi:hypothetical protein
MLTDMINIDNFVQNLKVIIENDNLPITQFKFNSESGVHINIDSDMSINTLSFYPDGLCDILFLYVKSENQYYLHQEFISEEEAFNYFIQQLYLAVERAKI